MKNEILVKADETSLHRAADIIRGGGLVGFPTETVYGLGADATNAIAVAKIFDLKKRPRFDPIIVHVASPEEAKALWTETLPLAEKLIHHFWPGPLTIVLPKTSVVPGIVTSGRPTVAVRMPASEIARSLISRTGVPIAAPSANQFGRPSPTNGRAVLQEFGHGLEMILDGGSTPIGVESTVVTIEKDEIVILRPGGVSLENLRDRFPRVTYLKKSAGEMISPGMLPKHYAPTTPIYLLQKEVPTSHPNVKKFKMGECAFLTIGRSTRNFHQRDFGHLENLSHRGDLVEAAARFFETIRKLENMAYTAIIADSIPEEGLGVALMDRLTRASSGTAYILKKDILISAT